MKTITMVKGSFAFIEVPNDFVPKKYGALDARNNVIWGDSDKEDYPIALKEEDLSISYNVDEHPKIISTTNIITEEEIKNIIEADVRDSNGFANYFMYKEYWFRNPKESFKSLIEVNCLDINRNYLILKLNK